MSLKSLITSMIEADDARDRRVARWQSKLALAWWASDRWERDHFVKAFREELTEQLDRFNSGRGMREAAEAFSEAADLTVITHKELDW